MKSALLLLSLFLFPSLIVSTRAAESPNIIVIMVDDMGFSDIACYGGEIPTPNLDTLAENGLKFSQFYNTGRCCPTRASLLTGLYAHQTGMGWMTADHKLPGYRGKIQKNCVTIAEVLRPAGYLTAITGKWHVGYDEEVNPVARGFDRSLNLEMGGVHFSNQGPAMADRKLHFNGEEINKDDPRLEPPWYGTHLWTKFGLKFADEAQKANKPFFWYLAHVAPHFPCMAPEPTIAKYRGKYMEGWDVLREKRYARQIASGLIDPRWPLTPRPAKIPAWSEISEDEKIRYDDMMAIYAAMIEELDNSVGTIVETLRERGQLDNTLILFLSDNGGNAEAGIKGRYKGDKPGDPASNVFVGQCWAHLSNTPFRKYKHYNHEGGTATPLIAHWPSGMKNATKKSGSQSDWVQTPTHVIDIMATCVDLAGATYPEVYKGHEITPLQGRSMRPLLTSGGTKTGGFEERVLFWEHEGNAAIRVGDRKGVRLGESGWWELYDMADDRTEQKNLATTEREDIIKMKADWIAWAESAQVYPKKGKAKAGKKKQ